MWPARAPQATISMGRSAFSGGGLEAELGDEAVVEVLAVAELDIGHLLEEGQGGGAVAQRQKGHLGALACYVARGDDAAGTHVGGQGDAGGPRGGWGGGG